ncbi:hypothetical protein SDC9_172280 [bioreactor metagenome]|uniref:Uncharacterized protein n=1 Tax=bioreactor metagenome TaxID=1076179 RepID=A0A645GDX3_9ZZZZ
MIQATFNRRVDIEIRHLGQEYRKARLVGQARTGFRPLAFLGGAECLIGRPTCRSNDKTINDTDHEAALRRLGFRRRQHQRIVVTQGRSRGQ